MNKLISSFILIIILTLGGAGCVLADNSFFSQEGRFIPYSENLHVAQNTYSENSLVAEGIPYINIHQFARINMEDLYITEITILAM